jgi:hypothetical protein
MVWCGMHIHYCNRWKRIKARGMKSGSWSEAEERRLVFAIVSHEKKKKQEEAVRGEGGEGSSGKKAAGQSSFVLWEKISECVPQRYSSAQLSVFSLS